MNTNETVQDVEARSIEIEVNRRVVMLMWDAKMTQTALAARLGFTQSGLSKKLHGRTGWGLDELAAAARVLNSSISYLVGETEDPHPATPSRGLNVGLAGLDPTTSTV